MINVVDIYLPVILSVVTSVQACSLHLFSLSCTYYVPWTIGYDSVVCLLVCYGKGCTPIHCNIVADSLIG